MATYTDFSDVHTNLARPKNSAILTVRVIKSFQYRTERSLVLKDINLETTTVGQLKDISRQAIQIQSGWKPYRNVELDAMKLYSQAHGAKTTNLIINLDHDEWILTDDSKTLAEAGFENETEVSFFNRDLYEQFRQNPKVDHQQIDLLGQPTHVILDDLVDAIVELESSTIRYVRI